ncbi:MAG: TetR family transcriptional regulator [Succinivibrio sp.]
MNGIQDVQGGKVDRRRIRGLETRKQLVRAAIELFGEHGFEATSTRAIAQRAGCNLGLISFHFGSKQNLYEEVREEVRREMESGSRKLSRRLEQIDTGGMDKEQLSHAASECVEMLVETLSAHAGDDSYFMMLRRCLQAGDDASKAMFDDLFIPPFRQIVRILDALYGEDKHRFNELKAFMALEAVFCLMRDYPYLSVATGRSIDVTKDTGMLTEIIRGVLGAK